MCSVISGDSRNYPVANSVFIWLLHINNTFLQWWAVCNSLLKMKNNSTHLICHQGVIVTEYDYMDNNKKQQQITQWLLHTAKTIYYRQTINNKQLIWKCSRTLCLKVLSAVVCVCYLSEMKAFIRIFFQWNEIVETPTTNNTCLCDHSYNYL